MLQREDAHRGQPGGFLTRRVDADDAAHLGCPVLSERARQRRGSRPAQLRERYVEFVGNARAALFGGTGRANTDAA